MRMFLLALAVLAACSTAEALPEDEERLLHQEYDMSFLASKHNGKGKGHHTKMPSASKSSKSSKSPTASKSYKSGKGSKGLKGPTASKGIKGSSKGSKGPSYSSSSKSKKGQGKGIRVPTTGKNVSSDHREQAAFSVSCVRLTIVSSKNSTCAHSTNSATTSNVT
jgi:hypothetical protein